MSFFSKVKKYPQNYVNKLAAHSPFEYMTLVSTPEFAAGIGLMAAPMIMDGRDMVTGEFDTDKSFDRNMKYGLVGAAVTVSPFVTKPFANRYVRKKYTSEAFENTMKGAGKPLGQGGFSSLPKGFVTTNPSFKDEWYTNVILRAAETGNGNLTYNAGEVKNETLLMPLGGVFKPFGEV